MTTSGVITGTMKARDIVTQALTLIGVATTGQTPKAADAAVGLLQLNWMLKSLPLQGANMWRVQDVTMTWPATATESQLDPQVIDVISCRVVSSPGFERELARWERGEYANLPNKYAYGSPTSFTFVKEAGDVKLRLWPVPSVDTQLTAQVQRVIEDVSDLNQTIDVPQEWTETIFYNLADRLLDPFGIAQSDPQTAQRITGRASSLLRMALDYDRPASVYMGPAYRSRGSRRYG